METLDWSKSCGKRLAIACTVAQSGTAELHSCSHQSCTGGKKVSAERFEMREQSSLVAMLDGAKAAPQTE
jgi:hypothetical protein